MRREWVELRLYFVGVVALHYVDIFVEVAVEEQADGLVGDVGTIHDKGCRYLVDATVVREALR